MKRNFTFSKWLKTKETFDSYAHYKWFLSIKTKEEAKQLNQYYHEKYAYWEKYLHTEFD